MSGPEESEQLAFFVKRLKNFELEQRNGMGKICYSGSQEFCRNKAGLLDKPALAPTSQFVIMFENRYNERYTYGNYPIDLIPKQLPHYDIMNLKAPSEETLGATSARVLNVRLDLGMCTFS